MCAQMTVDYVSSYFPHKNFPRIETWSTYNTSKNLKKIVKANVSSVVSNLDGSSCNYLGPAIPDSKYNITYKKPTQPGELKIKEDTPLHKAIILCELHNEIILIICETAVIEAMLKYQIISGVNTMY